jgi:5-methylcytosine-specific restriction endonuclease McrA
VTPPDTARALPEWIGAKPDTRVPARVRLRVFEAHGGRCYLTGVKIMPGDAWELDHRIALINGGENRESNLAPALKAPHRVKTTKDVNVKAKIASVRQKHLGVKKPSGRLKSRGFDKTRTRHMDGTVTLK